MLSPEETAEAALAALDEADPADAPEVAQVVADTLTAALEENDATGAGQDSEGKREGPR